jgi:hypothetical protein
MLAISLGPVGFSHERNRSTRSLGDAEKIMSTENEPTKRRLAEWLPVAIAWSLVSIPLAWGVLMTLKTAILLVVPSQ